MAETLWIKVTVPEGYDREGKSMVDNAAELIDTALHVIDHRAGAEVLTDDEVRDALDGT